MSTAPPPLQYVPFTTTIDPSFWSQLADRKLNHWKLDQTARDLHGYFVNSCATGVPCLFSIDHAALGGSESENAVATSRTSWMPRRAVPCRGRVQVFNTKAAFIELDRKEVLNNFAQHLQSSFSKTDSFDEQQSLDTFYLSVYVDLKKHHFYYWMCFPTICCPNVALLSPAQLFDVHFDSTLVDSIQHEILSFCEQQSWPSAFVLRKTSSSFVCQVWNPTNLLNVETDYLVFTDPSTLADNPGWPLRNLLVLYYLKNVEKFSAHQQQLRVLGLRLHPDKKGGTSCFKSVVWQLIMSAPPQGPPFTCVGWEKNGDGKLAPKFVDLSAAMDKKKLASSAVDLNLNLMRWRLMPEIDLDQMRSLKCLLFGAGTLGCYVARGLLAWGVRHITFIDNGNVSYSNPVRQSLYTFEDSSQGNRPKAVAAAQAVQQIQPSCESTGHVITVPMPGHVIADRDRPSVSADLQKIVDLVAEHDVIFLLTDSREGRWLPALLAAAHGKLAISTALGFDSFVVMRHGKRCASENSNPNVPADGDPGPSTSTAATSHSSVFTGEELGCYFCSDVTAPGNSTVDRTLDQQCTVTRPGVALLASGLAIELLSSIMQHQLKDGAPAVVHSNSDMLSADSGVEGEGSGCLGAVPHQIRGHLWRFTQMCCAVKKFDSCIACSHVIIQRYLSDGLPFIMDVCNDPSLLERLTGLTALQETANELEVWDFDDSQSVSSMEMT